jgi:hypothetical protein
MVKLNIKGLEVETERFVKEEDGGPELTEIVEIEWKDLLKTVLVKVNSVYLVTDPRLAWHVKKLIEIATNYEGLKDMDRPDCSYYF